MALVGCLLQQKRIDMKLSRETVQRLLDLRGYSISLYKIKRIENNYGFLNMKDVVALASVLDVSIEDICQCDDFITVKKKLPLSKEGAD